MKKEYNALHQRHTEVRGARGRPGARGEAGARGGPLVRPRGRKR